MTAQIQALVIGGGIAGLSACVSLRKKNKNVEIILIEPKNYFQVPWASYRSVFDAEVAEKSIFGLQPWAEKHNITHIQSTCTNLTESTCTLANGQTLENFACAVICAGAVCKWPALGRSAVVGSVSGNEVKEQATDDAKKKKKNKGPSLAHTKEERLAQLARDGDKLLDSGSVLVVGGGLIGCETAGDLAYYADQQNKPLEITLVHSDPHLIPEFPKRSSNIVHKKLTKLGVNVILNDKVVASKNKTNKKSKKSKKQPTTTFHLQKSGQDIEANHVVWTTGITSQNHAFLSKEYLTKKGFVKVDVTFQVENSTKLFAFGDCCNLLPNSGSQVMGAMNVLGHNLKTAVENSANATVVDNDENAETNPLSTAAKRPKKQKRLRKALVQPETYICTVGKKSGVALTPFGGTRLVLPRLKNKTMFLKKAKKTLGLV